MATMVPPTRAAAFTLYFSLYKTDGTIIANPGTYTVKVSKDGGALADATNAVTEIDTTYGALSLTLTAAEMTADAVWVKVLDNTAGCVPFTCTVYTSAQSLDTIDTNVDSIKTKTDYLPSATAGAAGGVFIAGSNAATTANITGNITGNVTGSVGSVTGAVGSVTGAVGSVTGNVGGNVTGSVGSVATNGITAASIATGAIDADALAADAGTEIAGAVWDAAMLSHITSGTVGDYLYNNSLETTSVYNGVNDPSIGLYAIRGAIPAAATVADAVWDETLADHTSTGSTGEALTSSGSAGDPWATSVPGAYTSGTAGYILGTNLDAAVSDTATGTDLATTDGKVDAIQAKTDNLPADPAATSDIPTATENADALLKRDWSSVTGEASRSVLNALRALRNKVSLSGATMTVTKENDSTAAWTAAVTTDPDADPITSVDPA